jgi:hypothetical protein
LFSRKAAMPDRENNRPRVLGEYRHSQGSLPIRPAGPYPIAL